MHFVRALSTGTVTGVIVWKLAALALLPAAFCCQAVLSADGGLACCEGKDHGDFCPLSKSPRSGPSDSPQLQTCESLDDALLGLLSLTGFTPESAQPPAELAARGRTMPAADSTNSFNPEPPSPPPNA